MKLSIADILKLKSDIEILQKYVSTVEQYDANCRELTGVSVRCAVKRLAQLSEKLLTVEVKVS